MSLQHIQKNSPRLLPKPAKFEKNPPNGYRVIRKTKCGAGGAGSSPIHKQASRKGRLITDEINEVNEIISDTDKMLRAHLGTNVCITNISLELFNHNDAEPTVLHDQ